MCHYFEEQIDRTGTDSLKWDGCHAKFGTPPTLDLLPMWIADMDFPSPRQVTEAIARRVERGVFGYTRKNGGFDKAICSWMERRYGMKISPEWILATPGVVPAIIHTIQALTRPGEGVIIQPPVYYPFADSILQTERTVVENLLVEQDGHYSINFEDLEEKARKPSTTLMVFSSPHNPVGRVWTREELQRVGDICADNGVALLSDEIHADIVRRDKRHTAISTLSDRIAQNTVTANAPSKTFNLAGLKVSYVIVPDKAKRTLLEKMLLRQRAVGFNVFGSLALEVAYTQCDDYLNGLSAVIDRNIEAMTAFIEKKPILAMQKPEGTYFAWIDFRRTGMSNEELANFILYKARIAPDYGWWFGPGGDGFLRFNLGCPPALVEKAIERLGNALHERL